jgi:hypothetical protein
VIKFDAYFVKWTASMKKRTFASVAWDKKAKIPPVRLNDTSQPRPLHPHKRWCVVDE